MTEDVWELYDTRKDFSLAHDLAADNPDKLKDMQALFLSQAIANHVLPIDDRTVERFDAKLAGRPDLMGGRTSLTLYPGMSVNENSFINLKNTSHAITADVVIPEGGANGVLLAQGGRFGGWAFYLKDGKPVYDYNFLGLAHYRIASDAPVPAGRATIRFEFTYDGGGLGKGGVGRIFVNDEKVAEGRIEQTQCCLIALDESADVGKSSGTPVSPDYVNPFVFTGVIDRVVVKQQPGTGAASSDARAAEDEAKEKRATLKE
jgi:arylsulfatase